MNTHVSLHAYLITDDDVKLLLTEQCHDQRAVQHANICPQSITSAKSMARQPGGRNERFLKTDVLQIERK